MGLTFKLLCKIFNNLSDFSGYFHISENGCALVLQKDLEYWLLDELIMEPCCALKYFPKIEVLNCFNQN